MGSVSSARSYTVSEQVLLLGEEGAEPANACSSRWQGGRTGRQANGVAEVGLVSKQGLRDSVGVAT